MFFDAILNLQQSKSYVESEGYAGFLNSLNAQYPNHNLYQVSTAWYENPEYICKAKGRNGDVVIGWDHD